MVWLSCAVFHVSLASNSDKISADPVKERNIGMLLSVLKLEICTKCVSQKNFVHEARACMCVVFLNMFSCRWWCRWRYFLVGTGFTGSPNWSFVVSRTMMHVNYLSVKKTYNLICM